MVDAPYMETEVSSYSARSILPVELIEVLKSARFHWVLCENDQPLFGAAFGQPLFRQEHLIRSLPHVKRSGRRVECLWSGGGLKRDIHGSCPPEKAVQYPGMTVEELLSEILELPAQLLFTATG